MGGCCSSEEKPEHDLDLEVDLLENAKTLKSDTVAEKSEDVAEFDVPSLSVKEPIHKEEEEAKNQQEEHETGFHEATLERTSVKAPLLDEDGAYLVYARTNDGTFFVLWKKQRAENALAFAKPKEGVRIPPFKYKGRTEVIRNVNRTKKAQLEGLLQWLKTAKTFQCSATLLEASGEDATRIPPMILILHFLNDSVAIMGTDSPLINLDEVDCGAAVLSNTPAEKDMRAFVAQGTATFQAFQTRAKQNAAYVEFMVLTPREL